MSNTVYLKVVSDARIILFNACVLVFTWFPLKQKRTHCLLFLTHNILSSTLFNPLLDGEELVYTTQKGGIERMRGFGVNNYASEVVHQGRDQVVSAMHVGDHGVVLGNQQGQVLFM